MRLLVHLRAGPAPEQPVALPFVQVAPQLGHAVVTNRSVAAPQHAMRRRPKSLDVRHFSCLARKKAFLVRSR